MRNSWFCFCLSIVIRQHALLKVRSWETHSYHALHHAKSFKTSRKNNCSAYSESLFNAGQASTLIKLRSSSVFCRQNMFKRLFEQHFMTDMKYCEVYGSIHLKKGNCLVKYTLRALMLSNFVFKTGGSSKQILLLNTVTGNNKEDGCVFKQSYLSSQLELSYFRQHKMHQQNTNNKATRDVRSTVIGCNDIKNFWCQRLIFENL